MPLRKVAAYCRVSTNKEEQEQSFEAQQRYFREKLSKENGYELIEIYADKGLTGTKFRNRTAFNQMLYDAGLDKQENSANIGEIRNKYKSTDYVLSEREPKFNWIFVKDSSRFARNTEVNRILNRLKDKGVYVYFEDLNKSTENETDKMLLEFVFSMAQQESLDKSNKVKFGNKRSAETGKVRNGNLYGYYYSKEENTLRENKEEADIVRKIFNMRLEGKGGRVIARLLNTEGILTRTGKKYDSCRVRTILQNPTYMGKLVRNRYETQGSGESKSRKYFDHNNCVIKDTDKVDCIIAEDVFYKVQELIKESTMGEKGVYKGRRDLATKIVCGVCGKNYIRYSSGIYNFYICANKHRFNKSCSNNNVAERIVEDCIKRYLEKGRYKKDVQFYINILKIVIMDKVGDLFKNIPVEKINKIEAEIDKYKKQLERLLDELLEDETGAFKEVFTAKKTAISEKIRMLEKEHKALTIDDKIKEEKLNKIQKIHDKIEEYADTIPEEMTREDFIKYHLVNITVHPNKELTVATKGMYFTLDVFELLGVQDKEIDDYLNIDVEKIDKIADNVTTIFNNLGYGDYLN